MKDIETVVSENIQKLIKEYNLTHKDLSTIAGVDVSTVGKWILKKGAPRMGAIQKISDHFGLPKSYILKEDTYSLPPLQRKYRFLPINVAAGLPENIPSVTDFEEIEIPDSIMGKWAGHSDIMIMRVNGESMNKTIPNGSLIAIKPTNLSNIKNNDIVVFSNEHEYSVKRFLRNEDKIVFRPHSTDSNFTDYISDYENSNLKIYGKVVLYIVEMD